MTTFIQKNSCFIPKYIIFYTHFRKGVEKVASTFVRDGRTTGQVRKEAAHLTIHGTESTLVACFKRKEHLGVLFLFLSYPNSIFLLFSPSNLDHYKVSLPLIFVYLS